MALCNYQVFLSFRGPDTRHNLVKYLYHRLQGLRIVPFLDGEEIEYGHSIGDEIMEAIEGSDICVPIFSPNFATSTPCLMEVAQMVKSKKEILPIFFLVKPCDVKYQRGAYDLSFAEHERKGRYPKPTIEEWRNALKTIGDINGLEFKDAAPGEIGDMAKPAIEKAALGPKGPLYDDLFGELKELDDFISKIWKLSRRMVDQDVTPNLVGIERDLPKMMRKLGFYYQNGVVKERAMTGYRVLVVCGMPGVGKTTLAKVVFHKISHLFQVHSLLENVRGEFEKRGEVSLQNRLIRELKGGGVFPEATTSSEGTTTIQYRFRKKRVLILLDDVDDVDQFKQIRTLAGELTWFGKGSAIILTTTKTSVIHFYKNQHPEQNQGNVINHHEVSPMNEDREDRARALDLFYKHAFPQSSKPTFPLDRPLEVYEDWSREITSAVEHLPYAIEKVGSYLNGKSHADWTETLNYLKTSPERNVGQILMKHFNSLRDHAQNAQNIFLDIACFFTGVEKTIPCDMWAALHWTPRMSVGDLENKCFLRIGEKNVFSMHSQLKLLGRQIVKNENPDRPWERSRLWHYEEVQKTFSRKKVTDKVKALCVAANFNKVDGAEFHHVPHLRFLELDEVDIEGNSEDLLPDLVWLDWRGCPKESSRRTEKSKLFAFNMKGLVILKLCSRPDRLTLDDWGRLMQKAGRLKVLYLKDCRWINASLEFPDSSLLKRLILEGCLHLKLNTTKSNFKNLVSFNMKGCKWVNHLPQALHSMKALEELLIDGTNIRKLQFEEGSLPALETLSACDCEKLREVTDSIRFLKKLKKLFLRGCKELNTLPRVFGELGQLQEMDLSYTKIKELPPCVKHCERLQVLKLARTFVKAFPEAIKDLEELKELDFTNCRGLSGKHCDITGLLSLRILRLKRTGITEVLARDEAEFCLHILELDGVTKLTWPGKKETSVSQPNRKRETQTGEKNSCVSQNKRQRDEE